MIALAALSVENDPLLLVLAADHIIENTGAFTNALKRVIPLAEAGKLVTFGVVPTKPNVGFGYIEASAGLGDGFLTLSRSEKNPTSKRLRDI